MPERLSICTTRLAGALSIALLTLFQGTLAGAVTPTPPVITVAVAQKVGNPNVRVWVNTNSGVYHCPGTRWYGVTKEGEYMTQRQAQNKGYRPAYRRVCE